MNLFDRTLSCIKKCTCFTNGKSYFHLTEGFYNFHIAKIFVYSVIAENFEDEITLGLRDAIAPLLEKTRPLETGPNDLLLEDVLKSHEMALKLMALGIHYGWWHVRTSSQLFKDRSTVSSSEYNLICATGGGLSIVPLPKLYQILNKETPST